MTIAFVLEIAILPLFLAAESCDSGVIWTTAPIDGDANREVVEGIVRAYDATQPAATPNEDGTPRLTLLWSQQISYVHFDLAKFAPPVVADGKLFVPIYSGRVDVYGLK